MDVVDRRRIDDAECSGTELVVLVAVLDGINVLVNGERLEIRLVQGQIRSFV